MKTAIIEASHWHVPLYLGALEKHDVAEVTAVCDETSTRGPEIAARFEAAHHVEWRELLDQEDIDFAFVFGRHDQMDDIASKLIERGIPFAIEKPAGLSGAQVSALADKAAASNHFVSVPLIFGFSTLIEELRSAAAPSDWRHMSFRFIAGPISRYITAHCDWMLQDSKAGGGCTKNLAVHCIDVFQRLTGSKVKTVSARMIRDPSIADVEIYSVMTLQTDSGQLCTIETGYTYPGATKEQREFSFSLASAGSYVQSTPEGLKTTRHATGDVVERKMDLNTDVYYAEFVRQSLRDFQEQRQPAASLADLSVLMRIIDGAYASDRKGGGTIDVKG